MASIALVPPASDMAMTATAIYKRQDEESGRVTVAAACAQLLAQLNYTRGRMSVRQERSDKVGDGLRNSFSAVAVVGVERWRPRQLPKMIRFRYRREFFGALLYIGSH